MNEIDQATHANSNAATQTSEYAESLQRETERLLSIAESLQIQIFGSIQDSSGHEEAKVLEVKSQPTAGKKKVLEFKKNHQSEPTHSPKSSVKQAASSDYIPSSDDPGFEEI